MTINPPTIRTSTRYKCSTFSVGVRCLQSSSPTATKSPRSASRPPCLTSAHQILAVYTKPPVDTDAMGLLNLVGIRSHPPTTLHAPTNRRSRNDNDALSFCTGAVSDTVYPELAVQVLCRGICGSDSLDCWHSSDGTLFGFLLDLLYQVSALRPALG